jgi:hypothetical protein
MTEDAHDRRRALVDLLPRFLMRRRVGWTGLQDLLAQHELARPEFFLLRAIVEETDAGAGMTYAGLCANLFNPYSTIRTALESLPALVERGCLVDRDGLYSVTPAGRALVEQAERGAHAYLTTLELLPAADLARLTETLAEIAGRMWAAPEPSAKPHQARVRRLPPARDDQTLARLDQAVYGLWTARDDAHMAAWRAAGFDGPVFDILSRVWSGEAGTLAGLNEALRPSQRPEDIARGLDELGRRGALARDGEALRLTSQGRAARDAIEAETDRVYFAPWPPFGPAEVAWLHDAFLTAYERLP